MTVKVVVGTSSTLIIHTVRKLLYLYVAMNQPHSSLHISLQLGRTSCSFSELNYTLIIENKQEVLEGELNTVPDLGSGVIELGKHLVRLERKSKVLFETLS